MVITLNLQHIYKFPIEKVLKTYLNKHQNENNIEKVDIVSTREEDEMTCTTRRVRMLNYFPQFFRKLEVLKKDTVTVEEEIWSQTNEKRHWIRSKDTTWDNAVIAHLVYLSPYDNNVKWTLWEQDTVIDLRSFGLFGTILEIYLKRHLQNQTKAEIKLMQKLMYSA